jgi:error-prone DNA polymerase
MEQNEKRGRKAETEGSAARPRKPFSDVPDLAARARVSRATLETLAAADAFRSLGLDRRQALWEVRGLSEAPPLPLFEHAAARDAGPEPAVSLPLMPLSEHVVNDYQTLKLSLKAHPMEFLRALCAAEGILACDGLRGVKDGARVKVAGVVLVRQRPGSASGVVFMTLEDETGIANIVVWKDAFEANRRLVMTSSFLVVHGQVQREGEVIHVVAERFTDLSHRLSDLREDEARISARSKVSGGLIRSRDFH